MVMLVGASLLFLDFTGSVHAWLGWIAEIQFVPAVLAVNLGAVIALVLLTFVTGRVYCSVICPLGIFQDGVSGIRNRIKKKNRYRFGWKKPLNVLRYMILVLFLVALIAPVGGFVASLLDPYSAFGRIMSNVFSPFWQWGNNALAYLAERADSYAFYDKTVWLKSLPTFLVALTTLIVVCVLAWTGGRTYCNSICPVGSLLGLVSRFSLFGIRFDTQKCNGCRLCEKGCKSSCINIDSHKVDSSRCVVCLDCVSHCRRGAVSYGWRWGKVSSRKPLAADTVNSESKTEKAPNTATSGAGTVKPEDAGRRAFVTGALIAAGSAALKAQEVKLDGGLAEVTQRKPFRRQTPLKPAGAVSLRHFSQHCTACQLCVSVCPNDVLRPSTALDTFMQPEMSYERGFCRPECTRCAEVCPNNAIFEITREEKSSTQIGHAVVNLDNCVVKTDEVSCGNCARRCPVGAIKMVKLNPEDEKSLRIPAVNEERCIGCGACEHLCPAQPFPAIHVEGHLVHKTI